MNEPPGIDRDAVVGCLLGQAVAEALGLPRESMSKRRGELLFPHIERHQFLFGRGIFSDDTEHAGMTGQALLASGGNVDRFRRELGRRFRWWIAGFPAGIGRATLKSGVRAWIGFPMDRWGVNSTGNGPAMRAPVLGVCFDDKSRLKEWVRVSSRMTHIDERAEHGAWVIAVLTSLSARSCNGSAPTFGDLTRVLAEYGPVSGGSAASLWKRLETIPAQLEGNATIEAFAETLGLGRGVTGFINHTVPVAVYAFFRHPNDYRAAVQGCIRCGGDTDTVAAIAGALVGARVGKAGIPPEWLTGIIDWPLTVRWIERLGRKLADGKWTIEPQSPLPFAWWAIPFRNLLFLIIVLAHVVRRLLPPY